MDAGFAGGGAGFLMGVHFSDESTQAYGELTMGVLAPNRKQRLRTLENHIRKAAEEIQKNGLDIGRDLCEIRDDELWREEGYESWNKYLRERASDLVGKSFTQAANLVQAAEVERRISPNDRTNLDAQHLSELGRLVPTKGKEDGSKGAEKDYSKLRKSDVKQVLKQATNQAKERGKEKPSVRDVRKAVDDFKGIDRAKQAEETKKQNQAGIELADYLRQCLGRIEGITINLAKVPGDSWKLLEESEPELAARVATACDELAELLRS